MNEKSLLEKWHERVRESQAAHYETSKYYSKLNTKLGVTIIILTSIVSSSFVSEIDVIGPMNINFVYGIASVLSVIFASLQTFYKYNEKAEKHRSSGAKYGSIRRDIEIAIHLINSNLSNEKELAIPIKEKINTISESSPEIPEKIWLRAK